MTKRPAEKILRAKHDDGIHPVGGGHRRHGLGAEAVHKVLEDQAARGADAGLEHGREAEMDSVCQGLSVKKPAAEGKAQKRILPDAVGDEKKGHGRLGEYSCDGCARHVPAEAGYEQDIQNHIDQGGEQDGIKRRPAVPDSAQSSRVDVIDGEKGNAGKDDPQVFLCQSDGVRRRVEKLKEGSRQPDADAGKQKKNSAEEDREGGQDPGKGAMFSISIFLGEKDRESQRKASDGVHIEIDEGCGGAYGGQSQLAFHVSHDKRVGPVVELLQDAA